MDTPQSEQELVKFMESLGFEYQDDKYYQHFSMNEGTCEMTIAGALELQSRVQAYVEQQTIEARQDELNLFSYEIPHGFNQWAVEHLLKRQRELKAELELLNTGRGT